MSGGFEQSRSRRLLASPRFLRVLAIWTLALLFAAVLALAFTPWQQTVVGTGKVTAFSPMQRPQTLEAPISGRLKGWRVMEGQQVEAGQVVAELEDLDPKFLDTSQIETLQSQKQALMDRKLAAQARVKALQTQLNALGQSRQAAIPGASEKVAQSGERIVVAEQGVEAAKEALQAARYNHRRVQDLYEKGLRSKRDLELTQLEQVRAQSGVEQARAHWRVAQRDVSVARLDRDKVSGDTLAAMASASAAMASAQETVASAAGDIAKLEVDIQNLNRRMAQRQIKAPLAGKVVRMVQVGMGETVSEGEVLAVVAPKTQDQAVELYLSGWDAPLVAEGRLVRLQFAGWPAIQFSGWPMVASGTFAGRVAVIDALDDGKGRYRILVKPDKEAIQAGRDAPWPSGNYLRPGTEATGWILLDTVSLGYELWRQFNAFPPTLKETPPPSQGADEKLPKRKSAK